MPWMHSDRGRAGSLRKKTFPKVDTPFNVILQRFRALRFSLHSLSRCRPRMKNIMLLSIAGTRFTLAQAAELAGSKPEVLLRYVTMQLRHGDRERNLV